MKINSLLESQTPSSAISNTTSSAPVFGRDDEHLDETTTSGSVATVASPVGGMQRRGKGSMLQGIKTSAKFPNSKAVKEGRYNRDAYQRDYDSSRTGFGRRGREDDEYHVPDPTPKITYKVRVLVINPEGVEEDRTVSLKTLGGPLHAEEVAVKFLQDKGYTINKVVAVEDLGALEETVAEADEWEEEGDKFQRFLAYAQKQLKAADPAQRISLARRLSMWQVKHFGPENNQTYNPNTGAAIQGNNDITPSIRAILEIVNRPNSGGGLPFVTVPPIPGTQQVEIDNSWRLTDEGKQWLAYAKEELQKAGVNSSDFMEVARALSQQQVKKFGRASMDTRNNITAEISMIIDKIIWESRVASQQANQNVIDAAWTVNDLMDNYNNASPEEKEVFRANVERDYGMSVQEFFDYLQQHDQLPQARRQPAQTSPADDVFAEAKKANTKTARKELSKKPKAELSGKDKEAKQAESDRLWAMLQQHIADAEKNKDVKEGQEVDASVVVGKLHDIIDHAENAIKNADYDHQVQYLTVVRDRAVKALNMIKTNPRAAVAAWKYFQNGEQGVAEDQLDEKSKSQAQFRTMAAVAHNPKFAKKVGISQKVGKEFHKADKKSDYEDLPSRADEEKQRLDPKCWTGYKKQGTKMKGGVRVNNCVKVDEAEFTEDKLAQDLYKDLQIFKKGADKDISAKGKDKEIGNKPKDKDIIAKEDWQKTNKKDKTDGMSPKAVKAYRRENPGSKLQTAVTKKPSELKAGSKDAKRRKSFCARMSGNKGPMKDENGKPTPKAKALKRWNCEE